MKKFSMLLALLSLTFVLAACGGDTPPVSSTPESSTPSEPAPSDPNPSDPSTDDSSHDTSSSDTPSTPSDPVDDRYNDPILPGDDNAEDGYGSGGSTTPSEPADEDDDGMLLLTLSQLSQYDGRNGRRAFIAVSGIIYEVTNSPRWAGGIHNGNSSISAGNDLTREINSISPHGTRVLDNIPVVGRLVDDNE